MGYSWVIPLKDKKGVTIINTFQEIIDESNCKPNKVWIDKDMDNMDRELYNRSMKSWSQGNYIEMCSTHNEAFPLISFFISKPLSFFMTQQ